MFHSRDTTRITYFLKSTRSTRPSLTRYTAMSGGGVEVEFQLVQRPVAAAAISSGITAGAAKAAKKTLAVIASIAGAMRTARSSCLSSESYDARRICNAQRPETERTSRVRSVGTHLGRAPWNPLQPWE